jgi:Tol biopolymer transport system component/DNA-binding winged helix-turn-helix (wHTH) protein
MPAPKASSRIVRFGVFEADLRAGELRKSGSKIKLQEQPFQILALLLEQPGELVTREDMQQRLWPADTFVDFDHGLNAAIKRLREALGDDADTPRYVETLPRRGYRFIAPVQSPEGASDPATSRALDGAGGVAPPAPQPHRALRYGFLGAALFLSLMLIYILQKQPPPSPAAPSMMVVPVTTLAGAEWVPRFSPEGNRIAFAWNQGKEDGTFNIYVQLIGAGEPLRLTDNPGQDFNPAWSPDGRYIAFTRQSDNDSGIFLVPALGGPERKIFSAKREPFWLRGLAWSPDGRFLAFPDKSSPSSGYSIVLLSLENLETRKLTNPGPSQSDDMPVFSPDGRSLAFVRNTKDILNIYVMDAAGGQPRPLTQERWQFLLGLAWTADGREIIYASNRGGTTSLWRIPASGGTPEAMPVGAVSVFDPEISRQGGRLTYVSWLHDENIWKIGIPDSAGHPPAPEKWISSTELDQGPQYSPDGSKIAFQSTRTGFYEIWVCNRDGSNPVQLTKFDGPLTGTPRWSPDGRHIVFDSRPYDSADIFVIKPEGGAPRRLTSDPSNEVVPSWSRDGKWIYFASDRTGSWQLWKIPAEGGPAVRVTHQGGFAAFESVDGSFLYYAKDLEKPGIWRVPVSGGQASSSVRRPGGARP